MKQSVYFVLGLLVFILTSCSSIQPAPPNDAEEISSLALNAPYRALDTKSAYNRISGYITLPTDLIGVNEAWQRNGDPRAEAGYNYFGFANIVNGSPGAIIDIGLVYAPRIKGWQVFSKMPRDTLGNKDVWKDTYSSYVIPSGTRVFMKLYIKAANTVVLEVYIPNQPTIVAEVPNVPGISTSSLYSVGTATQNTSKDC